MRRVLLGLLVVGCAYTADDAGGLFPARIQPVLKRDCLGCHGDGQMLANLDLRTREGMLKGGSRGPAIAPRHGAASLLVRALLGDGVPRMPPTPAPADREFIDVVRRWIDAGAPWSAAESAARWEYKETDVWAFRAISKPSDRRRSIDDFLAEKLRLAGLTPAPRADRLTLIRRMTVDLTGLPPTPEEVDAFVNDTSKDAWARLVDRLLASPRYGERWGRHWLDVVRYADTSGYSNDFERPNAWRYRDYVIRCFNQDKPYDRFIREQIAGDELYPGDAEALIATGFLRSGPWEHTGMSVEAVTRQMFLDDVTGAVGATFLGLTVGCARCHDHKFDPIPTRDYYRLQAVFATTEFARPIVPFLKTENATGLDSGKARMQEIVRRTQNAINSFDSQVKDYMMKKHGASRIEDVPKEALATALRSKEGLQGEAYEEYKLYQKHMQLYRESLDRFEPKAFVVSSGPLDGATDGGPNLRYPPASKYQAPPTTILTGGNIQSPAEGVTPGVLSAVERYGAFVPPEFPQTVSGRRAALASWIADPRNPLTARVMINRIWQYHFGRGLAADTNNLGKMGKKPSHPELLDWLAASFIDRGWSLKAMHRLMLLSEAYQRASAHPSIEAVRQKDPENQLLAHFSPRRIEAEVLRDSILAVAGELSSDAGGPGTFPQINEDVARQPRHTMGSVQPAYYPSPTKRERNRRTIYAFQQRSLQDPLVEVFNGPSPDLSCERREASTVATQAFALFHGQFVNDMALQMALRLQKEAPNLRGRIDRAYRLAYGRAADAAERSAALKHVEKMTAYHGRVPAPRREPSKPVVHTITSELTGENFRFVQQPDPVVYEHNAHPSEVTREVRALAGLALVLMNSNEFVYIY